MNGGREKKIDRMSLSLGGHIDGEGGRKENPALIKHFGSVLGGIFDDKIRENFLLFALD